MHLQHERAFIYINQLPERRWFRWAVKNVGALKSLATYKAMKEAEEGMGGGYSGARGRGANGQYISRGGDSYSSGYEQGYDDAMSRMSGNWRPTWNHGGTW